MEKVFVSERGFEKLFWRYWSATSNLKNKEERERDRRALLISWKRDGIPDADFLALDKFRREHDKRVANLTKNVER